MKVQSRSRFFVRQSLVALVGGALVAQVSCGKESTKSSVPRPAPASDNDKPLNKEPRETKEPKAPDVNSKGTEAALPAGGIEGLAFAQIPTDLPGDLRVLRAARDLRGDIYLALTAKFEKEPGDADMGEGYVILKIDASGKELWRFPTRDAAIASGKANGGYLRGTLVDMDVTGEGDVWLTGVRQRGADPAGTATVFDKTALHSRGNEFPWLKDNPVTAGTPSEPTNTFFVRHVSGKGRAFDAPRAAAHKIWYSRASMGPIAIRATVDGVRIETARTFGPTSAVLQESMVFDATLAKTKAGLCFVAPWAHGSSGKEGFVAITDTLPSAEFGIVAAAGCWDFMASANVTAPSETFRVYLPFSVAAGTLSYSVDTLGDLQSGKNAFENLKLGMNKVNPGSAAFASAGGEMVGVALGDKVEGEDAFTITNGRAAESAAWSVPLGTAVQRAPESLALTPSGSGDALFATWTDLHPEGESNAGNRALCIVKLTLSKNEKAALNKALQAVSYEVPAKLGAHTFTSVRMLTKDDGGPTVFATAGSTATGNGPGVIQASVLLMGTVK